MKKKKISKKDAKFREFLEPSNNYLKMHGLPMRRGKLNKRFVIIRMGGSD